jgi:DNA polymerase III delta subunit
VSLISDPVSFLRSLESFHSCPPLLFIQSADFIRPQRFVSAVIDKLGQKLVKRVDGRSLNTTESVRGLVAAINSRSLLASSQVIVLSNAEAISAEMQRKIVKSGVPPDFIRLILVARQSTQSPLLKWADENGGVVKFPELKEATLMRWIERELKFQGVATWEEQAVQGLAQSEDLDHLAGIIQTIGLYLDGEKLSKKVLKDFLVTDSEASDFELLDLITAGGGKAQLLLAQMMREGKNEFALLAFLQRSFTMLLRVKSYLERGVDHGVMRGELALSPWLLNKYISQASRYSLLQLRRAVDGLLTSEGKLKNRSLGAELVLDEALVFLKVGNG